MCVERVCESCAGEDDDLVLVRTVHDDGPAPGGTEGTELWCFGCRADQAHNPVEEQA